MVHDLEREHVAVGSLGNAPCHSHILSFRAENLHHLGRGKRLFGRQLGAGQVLVRLQVAEVLRDYINHIVGIEIAREAYGHIVGDIPLLMIVLDIGNRRIFKVLLCAEHSLRAIRVRRVESGQQLLVYLAAVLGQRHVFLLVDGFQLGVESSQYRMLETVGLYARPVIYLVGRNVLHIAGHIVTRIRVGAVCADSAHQLVVLVGDSYFRRLVAHRVDFAVYAGTLGAVGGAAICFKKSLDAVEQRLLGGIIAGSELFRALEHKMLEVVCKAGCFCRVVFASHAYGDICLNTWLVLIDAHKELKAIWQCVHLSLQRVAGHRFVLVFRSRSKAGKHYSQKRKIA